MNATLAPRKSRIGTAVLYAGFAVFYLFLAAMIPYSHDDWDWGLPIGLQHLLTADINSRYIGNFFEVIMTRSVIAKTLIMGACYFFIPYLLARVAGKLLSTTTQPDHHRLYLAANFLTLTINHAMLRQVYGWVAGFANYGIGMVFMLLCLLELSGIFQPPADKKASPARAVLYGLIAMCGQLFLENVTILMVVITLCALIYYRKKYNYFHWVYFAMVLGALVGAGLMFSNSIYETLFDTGAAVDGVRSFAFNYQDSLFNVVYKLGYQCLRLAMRLSEHSVAALAIVLLFTTHSWNVKSKYRTLRLVIHGALALYFLFAIFVPAEGQLLGLIGAAVSVCFYVCMGLDVLFFLRDRKPLRLQLLSLLICGVGAILPLAITCEYSCRTAFASYMFLLLFALVLFGTVSSQWSTRKKQTVQRAIAGICAAAIIMFCWCYGQIALCTIGRQQRIHTAIEENSTSVTLPAFPYEGLIWYPDPVEGRIDFFKEFYGIPKDMEVIFE